MLLTVGTYNASVEAVKHDPDGVKEVITRFFNLVGDGPNDIIGAVLGTQEMGQASWLPKFCKDNNIGLYQGEEPAAAATPILWDLPRDPFRTKSELLTKRKFVGSRPAGPSTTKEKYLNQIAFNFNGRTTRVANKHNSPSIWWPPNRSLIKKQDERTALYLADYEGQRFVTGDRNHDPFHKFNRPLREEGLMSTQEMLYGPIPTRKTKAIDDIDMDDDNRTNLIGKHTWKTPGDHKLYYVVVDVTLGQHIIK